MIKASIILPTYNEAGNIVKLISTIANQPNLKPFQLEFIVIDDDSPDGTAEQVKNLTDRRIKLIVRKNQRGLATAILKGIKNSTGDIILLMDADFNHRPEDIYKLITPIVKNQADLVIGSRYVKGGGMHLTEANKLQFFLSKYGNFFVNRILLGLPVHESLSGFLAIKKPILNKINLNQIFYGYGDYCIRLLYKVFKKNSRIIEVPIIYGQRQYGQSKSKIFKMFISYLKTAINLKYA